MLCEGYRLECDAHRTDLEPAVLHLPPPLMHPSVAFLLTSLSPCARTAFVIPPPMVHRCTSARCRHFTIIHAGSADSLPVDASCDRCHCQRLGLPFAIPSPLQLRFPSGTVLPLRGGGTGAREASRGRALSPWASLMTRRRPSEAAAVLVKVPRRPPRYHCLVSQVPTAVQSRL
jgi:hypothetical protein